MKNQFLVIISFIILNQGCGLVSNKTNPTKATYSEATKASITRFTEMKPTITKTGLPSTKLIIIEPTETQTEQKEITATLDADDKISQIGLLLSDNGGCNLPCWWGITPGRTSWKDAKLLLSRLATRINEDEEDYYIDGEAVTYFQVNLTYVDKEGVLSEEQEDIYITGSDEIKQINLYPNITAFNFLFRQVLMANSIPEKMGILTYSQSIENNDSVPLYLVLVYANGKVVLQYQFYAKVGNGSIQACDYNNPPYIWIWKDGKEWGMQQLGELLLGQQSQFHFMDISEATGIKLADISDEIVNNDNFCITTQSELWK